MDQHLYVMLREWLVSGNDAQRNHAEFRLSLPDVKLVIEQATSESQAVPVGVVTSVLPAPPQTWFGEAMRWQEAIEPTGQTTVPVDNELVQSFDVQLDLLQVVYACPHRKDEPALWGVNMYQCLKWGKPVAEHDCITCVIAGNNT